MLIGDMLQTVSSIFEFSMTLKVLRLASVMVSIRECASGVPSIQDLQLLLPEVLIDDGIPPFRVEGYWNGGKLLDNRIDWKLGAFRCAASAHVEKSKSSLKIAKMIINGPVRRKYQTIQLVGCSKKRSRANGEGERAKKRATFGFAKGVGGLFLRRDCKLSSAG